jgi:hypothetical protein
MMHIGLGTRLILYILHYQTPCNTFFIGRRKRKVKSAD